MKTVLLNIKNFAKNECAIFAVIIICVVSSAFIINFSYGLYYNYTAQKNETELELKNLAPEPVQGAVITKGEFQRFAESLDEKTLNAMLVIYAGASFRSSSRTRVRGRFRCGLLSTQESIISARSHERIGKKRVSSPRADT